jgi:hypothetical protein
MEQEKWDKLHKELDDALETAFEPKHETIEEAAEIDLSLLCYYDKRNPDYLPYDGLTNRPEDCSCDNCFYGRSALTDQLIRQAEKMYSEEEVIKLLIDCKDRFGDSDLNAYTTDGEVKQWFEKKKKK